MNRGEQMRNQELMKQKFSIPQLGHGKINEMILSERLGPDQIKVLEQELIADEGFRTDAYKDGLGNWTIGIGHFLGKNPVPDITRDKVFQLFASDLTTVIHDLDLHLPWWINLNQVRQRALINLCFNMGIGDERKGLLSFHNTLAYLQSGSYNLASAHLAKSAWAHQVQESRSSRIIKQVKEGV